jgi:deoxyribonuclease V
VKPARQHPWNLAPAQARALQAELAAEVVSDDAFGPIERVAGIDIGFEDHGRLTRAAVVVLRLADLAPLDQALARRPTNFPYVPGLLSFREIPAASEALGALQVAPDLLVCDGQGFAHPRRFGLACHLGWLFDRPCIGVAKSRLIGTYEEPGAERGCWTPLCDDGAVIGAALRTRARTKPVFVSVGHRVSLRSAVAFTLALTRRYRLPETTRLAHRLASPTRAAEGPEA